jgi:hypothetical protein
MIVAFVRNSPYPTAPFSTLYLFGRGQDIGFQKAIDDSPRKRHHIRIRIWVSRTRAAVEEDRFLAKMLASSDDRHPLILSKPSLAGTVAQNPDGDLSTTVRTLAGLYRGFAPIDSLEMLDFAGDRPNRPMSSWTLPGPGNWTLPGAYDNSRLSAPRDGAILVGTGGRDGFRIIPVVPSSDTSASG